MPSAADVARLEAVAYDLWRAPEVEKLDGWRLRHAHAFTGRANSVWANSHGGVPLEAKLACTEAWYAGRGLPARFQITDAVQPAGLADALLARGYEQRNVPVAVEVARVDDVVARSHGDAAVSEQLDDSWLELWTGARGVERPDVARAVLTGSPGPTAFARMGDEAVGRGVVVGDWFGITSMTTVPTARRRGHARAIVGALARWASDLGATRALLQVEESNAAARALYRRVGFAPSHSYHYLVQPSA